MTLLVAALSSQFAAPAISQEYDHDNYYVVGQAAYNYIACQDASEIPKVLSDYRGVITTSAEGSLALRGCRFVTKGDSVFLVSPAQSAVIEGRTVDGYHILFQGENRLGKLWFPRQFIVNVFTSLKSPPPAPKKEEPAPEPTYEPVDVPDIYGDLPTGRWVLWNYFEPEEHLDSNNGRFDYHIGELEISEEGMGSWLQFHGAEARPKEGIRFPATGSYVWTRGEEFAWEWEITGSDEQYVGYLILQTHENDPYAVRIASDELIIMNEATQAGEKLYANIGDRILMVRLGTDLDYKILRFAHCVRDNEGKKLYELSKCADPFVGLSPRPSKYG